MKTQNGSMDVHSQTCGEANNNSPSVLLNLMNCRGSTLFKYVITNRKKIFLFLCAFIMGTWIGSSFPYNQFGRNLPMGNHNCANAIPSMSAMGTGSTGAIRETPKRLIFPRNSTPSAVLLKNETRSNETHWITTQTQKGEQRGRRTNEPTPSYEVKLVSTSYGINKTSSSNATDNESSVNASMAGREYLVDSPSCKIPNFDPWDPSLLHAIHKLDQLNCGNQRQLTYVQNWTLAINYSILESDYGIQFLANVSCCYRAIQRPNGTNASDEKYAISEDCFGFVNSTPISDEFLQVECKLMDEKNTRLTEFHYTVPKKSSVEARCGNGSSDAFSVMLLGLDAVSRLNFQRHLVKTRKVLLEEMGAVELLGYNKVGDNTFPNLVPLLSGLSSGSLKGLCWPSKKATFDECPWVWKDFADAGYRTMYGEDSVQITSFNYLKPGFRASPTDYYLRPFLGAAEAAIGRQKVVNTQLCLGPQPYYEVTLGWAARFMEAFEDRPYFGLVWSNSLTHDDADLVQHADNFLSVMLARLHASGRLNRTILVALSDHGLRWGALRKTPIGRYEERLPALYVSLPAAFRSRFPRQWRALAANAQRLTSPFDLHATLRDVLRLAGGAARGPPPEAGQSLFEPVPLNRTCSEAGINAHWCACQETVALDVRQAEAVSLARFLLSHLNNRTKEFRSLCSVFSLSKVLSVLRKSNLQMREEADGDAVYVVTVEVTPGGGIFETTVMAWDNQRLSVEGDISRLNMYGTQSQCVQDTVLRKTCYCINQ